jgi:hypothetical protein
MNNLILITFFTFISSFTFSQDTIIKSNGDKIICKILKEDSLKIHYTVKIFDKDNYGSLYKTDIKSIIREKTLTLNKETRDVVSTGLGVGLDYGGIGCNLLIYPQKNIGIFGGCGYVFAGLGWNAGVKLRFIKQEQTSILTPFFTAMYGYNAAISYNYFKNIYYGKSFGFGVDYRSKFNKKRYWSFALNIPIRDPQADKDLKSLNVDKSFLPFNFSIGLRLF